MKADREIKVRCSACGHLTRIPTVTNADRIRAMTDEELAEWIAYLHCPHYEEDDYPCDSCEECWFEWLKQEVTDD